MLVSILCYVSDSQFGRMHLTYIEDDKVTCALLHKLC